MSAEPDDLKPFTRALAGIPPHPGQLDRDALLFAAGQFAARAGRLRRAIWPATAALFSTLSAVLAVVLVTRSPGVVEVERVVYLPAPASPKQQAPGSKDDPSHRTEDSREASPDSSFILYPSSFSSEGLRLRQRILRDGVRDVPQAPWAAPPPSSDDVPDLASLRLNASQPFGERFR
jgi:hypothetical protein